MNMNALRVQPFITLPVMLALIIVRVNFAIDLNAQPGFGAIEVQNIRPKRMLIAKHQTLCPVFYSQP